MRICFGVNDIPYHYLLHPQEKRVIRWRLGKKPWQALPGTMSTGDIAEVLEKRYHIFETFVKLNGDLIKEAVGEALRGRLENALMGAPDPDPGKLIPDMWLSRIEERFKEFLDRRELDGQVAGVPTQAAQKGVNMRLAHPYRKGNSPRPSFISSGQYQANARVWSSE
jgi:hypothetical protein